MKDSQRKAMFAKAKLNHDEWKQIVASKSQIVKDQNQMMKYYPKIARDGGFAFSDMDKLKNAKKRLDKKLEKLAKKYEYTPDGYTKYQTWHDHKY